MITEQKFLESDPIAKRASFMYGQPDEEECHAHILAHKNFLQITDETPPAHVAQICKYIAWNWYSTETRRINHQLENAKAEDEMANELWDLPEAESARRPTEEEVIYHESAALMKNFFKKLSRNEADAINAHYYPITNKEIAETEGTSTSAIDHRTQNAKKKLKPELTNLAREYRHPTDRKNRGMRIRQPAETDSADFYHRRKDVCP